MLALRLMVVKFRSNINKVIEDIADCGAVDTAAVGGTLDLKSSN